MLSNTLAARSRFSPYVARCWLCHLMYGWKFAPSIATFERPFGYVKAMLFAASADELSGPERRYVLGLVEVFVAGGGIMQQSGSYEDPVNINDLITFIEHAPAQRLKTEVRPQTFSTGAMRSPLLAKIMLYDAVRAATADGVYDALEQEHVGLVGKQLGVPKDTVGRIELLAKKEGIIAAHKRSLLLGRPVTEGLAEQLDRLDREHQQEVLRTQRGDV